MPSFKIAAREIHEELKNFLKIIEAVHKDSNKGTALENVDIHKKTIPLRGSGGGDHATIIDFSRRFNLETLIEKSKNSDVRRNLRRTSTKAGILITDVAGHKVSDACISAQFYQAFMLGASYELENNGRITPELFERINNRFFNVFGDYTIGKFIASFYAEIRPDGRVSFICAGSPFPLVYSKKFDKIMDIKCDRFIKIFPMGSAAPLEDKHPEKRLQDPMLYKEKYSVQELKLLGKGDIMIVYSDGFTDHREDQQSFVKERLEEILREHKNKTSKEISQRIEQEIIDYANREDDITYVVVKRNH